MSANLSSLQSKFGDGKILSIDTKGPFHSVSVKTSALIDVLGFLKDENNQGFVFLESIIGLDSGDELEVIYQLLSIKNNERINVRTKVSRSNPVVPSITPIWPSADYYELELKEMFGFAVTDHPNPRAFLLPEDWVGHPLRKDYIFPETYHGIEHRRAPLRKEHLRP